MSDLLRELEAKLEAIEAKLDACELLLNKVEKTCGQGNCNCVGSNDIKRMVRELRGPASVERGAR